ncbi:MAG: glycosyltransferase [Desulfosporosinus sp.]|nr:glycosyltransferase [Desulfosporosinus sp.]
MNSYEVSIIIPCYNEERFIKMCLDSIFEQSFPIEEIEILVIDGLSNDQTIQIVKQEIEAGRTNIRLFHNPKRIQASAINIGVQEANGKYIVRLDAHSTYERAYVEKCIALAKDTRADNVGGIAIATAKTRIGKAISLALACPFGVGNSVFRLGGIHGEVESVPFGTFPSETFEKFGLFNESLARCEDKEYNQRIRKGGGRVYMSKDIKIFYHNRETISGIAKQSYNNGLWNVFTLILSPGSVSVRHFVPLMFVSSLIGLSAVTLAGLFTSPWLLSFVWLLALDLGFYFILNALFSLRLAFKNENGYLNLILLPLIFLVIHISYGLGSMEGLCRLPMFISKVASPVSS